MINNSQASLQCFEDQRVNGYGDRLVASIPLAGATISHEGSDGAAAGLLTFGAFAIETADVAVRKQRFVFRPLRSNIQPYDMQSEQRQEQFSTKSMQELVDRLEELAAESEGAKALGRAHRNASVSTRFSGRLDMVIGKDWHRKFFQLGDSQDPKVRTRLEYFDAEDRRYPITQHVLMKHSPLKLKEFFWPPSNILLVISFWFFWAQITAISFVPEIRCWSRGVGNATSIDDSKHNGDPGGPTMMSATVAEDVCSWLSEAWRTLGRYLLFTIDFHFDLKLFDVNIDETTLFRIKFWIAFGVAVLFPIFTRAYHRFFKDFRAKQDELNEVLADQTEALSKLKEQESISRQRKEHEGAINNDINTAKTELATASEATNAAADLLAAKTRNITDNNKTIKEHQSKIKNMKARGVKLRTEMFDKQQAIQAHLREAKDGVVEQQKLRDKASKQVAYLEGLPLAGTKMWLVKVGKALETDNARDIQHLFACRSANELEVLLAKTQVSKVTNLVSRNEFYMGTSDNGEKGPQLLAGASINSQEQQKGFAEGELATLERRLKLLESDFKETDAMHRSVHGEYEPMANEAERLLATFEEPGGLVENGNMKFGLDMFPTHTADGKECMSQKQKRTLAYETKGAWHNTYNEFTDTAGYKRVHNTTLHTDAWVCSTVHYAKQYLDKALQGDSVADRYTAQRLGYTAAKKKAKDAAEKLQRATADLESVEADAIELDKVLTAQDNVLKRQEKDRYGDRLKETTTYGDKDDEAAGMAVFADPDVPQRFIERLKVFKVFKSSKYVFPWEQADTASETISTNAVSVANIGKELESRKRKLQKCEKSLKTLEADKKRAVKDDTEKKEARDVKQTALTTLQNQKEEAGKAHRASVQEEEALQEDLDECEEKVKGKQKALKAKTVSKRRCGSMYAFFDAFTAVLYLNVMRVLAKGLACHGYGGNGASERLIALPDRVCFTEWHGVMAPLAVLGLMCLYPSAVLTRPLFQALDTQLNLKFDYWYLFVFGQIQTLLLLCSAFFPGQPAFLLAFGFSACVNIAALLVLVYGDDYGPSIFLFVYVGWVIWIIICTIQAKFFPDPTSENSEYAFLRHPNAEQRLQIRMTMRTEVIIRGLDLMTDAIFFYDAEGEEHARFINWSAKGQFCTAIFATYVLAFAVTRDNILY
eukprot:g2322.t1